MQGFRSTDKHWYDGLSENDLSAGAVRSDRAKLHWWAKDTSSDS